RADLLRQVGRVRANHRTERTATAAELRHARRAVTGAAGALLLVHLLAGAPDFGAALCLVRSGLALVELPLHATLDDVGMGLETEDRVRELNRSGFLAFKGRDFQFHLTRPPARPEPEPARRRRPSTCRAWELPSATASSRRRVPGASP